MTPVTFNIFLLTVKNYVLHLGTDGILHVPKDPTLPSWCLLRCLVWYFTFTGGTGWIRMGHKISESLNNFRGRTCGGRRRGRSKKY